MEHSHRLAPPLSPLHLKSPPQDSGRSLTSLFQGSLPCHPLHLVMCPPVCPPDPHVSLCPTRPLGLMGVSSSCRHCSLGDGAPISLDTVPAPGPEPDAWARGCPHSCRTSTLRCSVPRPFTGIISVQPAASWSRHHGTPVHRGLQASLTPKPDLSSSKPTPLQLASPPTSMDQGS